MGNCEQQAYHVNTFELDMVDADTQSLQQNLTENRKQAPSTKKAKRSQVKPNLLEAVQKTYDQQIKKQKIEFQPVSEKSVALPVYYIFRKEAYYEGEWFDGMPHGKGKLYFSNGCYFEGTFKHGEGDCNDGLFIYPDGSFKRGKVKHSKFNGKGFFKYSENNLYYVGQWRDDQPDGNGTETYSENSYYKGQFKNGKKHGEHCEFVWENGKKYVGAFEDGFMQGFGTLTYKDSVYEGYFDKNLKVGKGTMKTQKGVYVGAFERGQMSGEGKFTWTDGKIYIGEFRNGQLHGRGTIYYPNGQKASGEWVDGQNKELEEIGIGTPNA